MNRTLFVLCVQGQRVETAKLAVDFDKQDLTICLFKHVANRAL